MKQSILRLLTVLGVFLGSFVTASAAEWDILWTQTYNTSAHYDYAYDTETVDNALYVVGTQYYNKDLSLGGQGGYRIERRNASTGGLVWQVTGNVVGGLESAHTVVADASYVYVGIQQGYNHNGAGGAWRIEKRNASNGGLVWAQVIDPTGYSDAPVDMVLAGNYLYIVGIQNGGGGSSPNGYWRLEKRNASNGNLVWAQVYRYASRNDYPFALAVSGTSIFTAGRYAPASGADYRCVVQRRNESNGTVVWTQYHNPTSAQDDCRGISTDGTTVYVTGQQYGGNMFVQRRSATNGSLLQNVSFPGGNFFQARGVLHLGTQLYAPAMGTNSGIKKINTVNLATLATSPANVYGYGASGSITGGAMYNLTGGFFTFDAWTVKKIDLAITPPNQPPTATINTPATNVSVPSGNTISFSGTGTDTDGTIAARQWRDGACTGGTVLSTAASFTKNDFTSGAHTVYFRVQDNDGAWSSCDSVTVTIVAQPDLTTLTPAINAGTPAAGSALTFRADARNIGLANAATAFSNRFQIDLNSDGTYNVNLDAPNSVLSLAAGANRTVTSPSWTAIAGTHRIRMCADSPTSTVTESNEGNNCGPQYIFTIGTTVAQCNDGVDNADSEDTLVDMADPGCTGPTDTNEANTPVGQCNDGVDNTDPEDTLVDMADPGCTSSTDTSETDTTATQCNDNIDNDSDGDMDYPADSDCGSSTDTTEGSSPACSDNVDNDGDGLQDENDPGCHTDSDPGNVASYNPLDTSEFNIGSIRPR